MPKRVRTATRKEPTQARSRAMVDALLDATTRILVKEGWDALSTNRVAQVAGVSVGSLYQYFPSKESLLHAVMKRWGTQVVEEMTELATSLADASIEEGVPILVRAALDISRVDLKLHRALREQVPRIGALDALEDLNRRFTELLASWLERHEAELGVDDPTMAAHMVIQMLAGLTEQALLYRPELFTSTRFQRHLERMVGRYLMP